MRGIKHPLTLAGSGALLLLASLFTLATASQPAAPNLAQTCARVEKANGTLPTYLLNCGSAPQAADSVSSARALLAANAAWLGLRSDLSDLPLLVQKESLGATHVRFQQTYGGLPVWLAEVAVHISHSGEIQLVQSSYQPKLDLNTQPTLTSEQAVTAAAAAIKLARGERGAPTAQLLIFPVEKAGARLAWHVFMPTLDPLGDWHVFVDAQNGAVLDQFSGIAFDSGSVYDPNAVQASGNPTLTDNNNANSPDLQAARRSVTLQGINAGQNKLIGPYVNLCAPGISGYYKPPCQANEPTRVFDYTRDNDKFEEATIYYALDSVQRYIQSLGFNNINNRAIPVHAHYYAQDNSFFSTSDNGLHFGDGGVDDAEDADVIVHEYGHSIQHNQVPGWGPGSNTEQRAMGEGFGDYLAASFYADRGDVSYQANQAPCIADWDAVSYAPLVNGAHCLRRVDGKDENSGVDIGRYNGVPSEEHNDGRYWSAALWCIRSEMGRENADRLILQAQFYATPTSSNQAFEQGVDALILADSTLYQGAHASMIYGCAVARGLVPVLPMATPTLTFPAGGETLLGGSAASIAWVTNGAPISATYTLELTNDCTSAAAFADDMELGASHWITSQVSAPGWQLQTASAHSPTHAWFAASTTMVSNQVLQTSQPLTVPAQSLLVFWHAYNLETGYDGGVIELSTNGGFTWADLGAQIIQRGYNQTISSSYGSPIAGRRAFSGDSGGYIETRVDLSSFAGQRALIRFYNASDSSIARVGWYVDDVRVVSSTPWTALGTSAPGATSFAWLAPNTPGADYCVRLKGQAPGYEDSPWDIGEPFTIVQPVYLPFAPR
jgi:Zn-dependent metalloprotease